MSGGDILSQFSNRLKRLVSSNLFLIFILIFINFLVHFRIIAPNVISFGDFDYFYSESLADKESPSPWNDAYNYGGQEFAPFRAPLDEGYEIVNLDKHISEKLLIIYPTLIIASIAPFLMGLKLTRSRFIGICAFAVFNFNTYFLTSSEHFLLYSSAAFAMMGIYLYFISFSSRKIYSSKRNNLNDPRVLLLSSLVPFYISSIYDFRITYIAYMFIAVLTVLFLLLPKLRRRSLDIKNILYWQAIYWLLTIILNLYWLKLIFLGGGASSTQSVGRSLFGDQFWGLDHAFALHHPFWTFDEVTWFIDHPVPLILWLIPISAFACLYFYRNALTITVSILALFGIFLVKQSDAPFGGIYQTLYDLVPGFNAYREATKFYFLIVICYTIMISWTILGIIKWEKLKSLASVKYLLIITIISPFLLSVIPIVNGNHGSIYQNKNISSDYINFKNHIADSDESYRILWVPQPSIWGFSSAKNPSLNLSHILQNELGESLNSGVTKVDSYNFFLQDYANYVLDYSSVKYIAVPLDNPENSDTSFNYYENSRQQYIDLLDSLPYLKKVDSLGLNDLIVFENFSYLSRATLATNDVSAQDVNTNTAFLKSEEYIRQKTSINYFNFLGDNFATSTLNRLSLQYYDQSKDINSGEYRQINSQVANLIYKFIDGRLNIEANFSPINSQFNELASSDILNGQIIYQTPIEPLNSDWAFIINDQTIIPAKKGTTGDITKADQIEKIEIGQIARNFVNNGNFSAGLWQPTVSDCNNYDDNPIISMALDEFSEDQAFLTLTSQRHVACTYKNLDFNNQNGALLNLDYRINSLSNASVGLVIDGQTWQKFELEYFNDDWNKLEKSIILPDSYESAEIYLYADEPDNPSDISLVDFRNISVRPIFKTNDITDETTNIESVFEEQISINQNINIEAPNIDTFENLISNSTFENELWQDEVQDCLNYDDNGNIAMSRDNENLVLSATRHVACSFTEFDINESGSYLLSLDYEVLEGNNASLAVILEGGVTQDIKLDIDTSDLSGSFYKFINVPAGTNKGYIYLYSTEIDGEATNTVAYDNIRIAKTINELDVSVLANNVIHDDGEITQFISSSPYRKEFVVSGSRSELKIIFNNLYDESWNLYIKSKNKLYPVGSQYLANGVFNGWSIGLDEMNTVKSRLIDQGNINFVLIYDKQSQYQSLYYLSLITFGLLICYALYNRKVISKNLQ